MGREFAQEELEEESLALQATAANGTGGTLRVCVATIAGRAPNNGATTLIPARIPMEVLEEFVEHAEQEPENLSDDLTELAQSARRVISEVSG
jgi:hypothetical protein